MNSKQLIEEGRHLMRPCVHLKQSNKGAPLAALWGGSGSTPLSDDISPMRHWLSLDCRCMPEGFEDLTGCLSVYVDTRGKQGIVAVAHSMQLGLSHTTGLELFAHPGSSWPPIDAIFRFGSSPVKDWIAKCGWKPEWLYNSNFKDHHIVSAYEEHIREQNPFFREEEDVYAMLGGWHESWPENDWCDLLDKRLVVFTYQEAEPWVEVWVDRSQNFQVIQRVS